MVKVSDLIFEHDIWYRISRSEDELKRKIKLSRRSSCENFMGFAIISRHIRLHIQRETNVHSLVAMVLFRLLNHLKVLLEG